MVDIKRRESKKPNIYKLLLKTIPNNPHIKYFTASYKAINYLKEYSNFNIDEPTEINVSRVDIKNQPYIYGKIIDTGYLCLLSSDIDIHFDIIKLDLI